LVERDRIGFPHDRIFQLARRTLENVVVERLLPKHLLEQHLARAHRAKRFLDIRFLNLRHDSTPFCERRTDWGCGCGWGGGLTREPKFGAVKTGTKFFEIQGTTKILNGNNMLPLRNASVAAPGLAQRLRLSCSAKVFWSRGIQSSLQGVLKDLASAGGQFDVGLARPMVRPPAQ
jgi:hypothetical protein